ncbi:MAG: LemA family protein [Gemmatimonadales bacterium]|jgi:LemA protein|nr:LemA family protein [Gemmatimonadales bacterium]
MGVWILLALVALGVYVAVTFNGLKRLQLLARNAYADIDVQLKRRHDLIPSLVAAVQGHAGYEKSTVQAVTEARNRAVAATGPTAVGEAERAVAGSVRQLLAVAEAYPELRAGESFLALQRSLTEIEDHVQNARRYYNAVVRDLNTEVAQFPSNLVAGPLGFRPQEFFGLTSEAEAAVPRVEP